MAGALDRIKEWPRNTKNYLTELQSEMKRVTWPNRKQVESTTVVVIFTVFAFAAFFALVDSVLNHTIVRIQEVLTK